MVSLVDATRCRRCGEVGRTGRPVASIRVGNHDFTCVKLDLDATYGRQHGACHKMRI